MSTVARRRIVQDISRVTRDPPHGVRASPFADSMMHCHAIIHGPEDTMWECGTFHLIITFTEDYPAFPPKVRFLSRLFHPNVYADGRICIDILQNQWSAMYDIAAVLTSIQSLLSDPNPQSPANPQAAKIFVENREEYDRLVLQCVEDSWSVPALPAGILNGDR
ncbi:putative ubiquitin conjugating enzyme E2 [Toxoplasma gondii TgCatPRC2]|uniref:Ubiquitin conjugating enzyme E2, putative n=13 Tax=Toxoplasma gondii TaxID=5811 RepID=A0A125YIU2_TOXGM|nr:ubiquitin conjugating enzyme E2, putative [Toxoplasma gondii ME49]EPR62497.1 putative ubiquitin conjugating enzyme E2 [Toxoplasma gondii GT1]ESS31782.1 putative ubiquitin conjugating enzyme E2 [Toxoplasma gondii VEG]KAF4640943.1 putative ubiquitin conjugating enzyme E2 [Toxoplasma gondii]KFG30895.1 putative ubiquitin conjugating enzyme E2 [Toxoplasma gondii GAB2-2007-GAL-DOM2]KFG34875.1 putative ubiquitin conjugating enzyme E2 [Toxoplasma gondii p89]KFG52512.1 putative ubiquitin conjugatin|eukprot:XP_008887339.1 ubiquitin conjugating enzyme E2, putative [Hammondia hammondi]